MHEVGWENQQVIRSNAATRAYAFETQGVTAGMQADMYGRASGDALTAGKIGVASTILGGVTSVATKWMQGSTTGIFSGSGGSGGPGDSIIAGGV